MSFDEQLDALKKKMLAERLAPEEMISRTQKLRDTLEKEFVSKRIRFEYDLDEEEGPRIGVFYATAPFHIGTIWLHGGGSYVFGSQSEYFPPMAGFDSEQEFLKEIREFLMEGLAAFELDEEAETIDV